MRRSTAMVVAMAASYVAVAVGRAWPDEWLGVRGTPYKLLMKTARVISIVLVALLAQGCGTGMVSQFPHRLIGADGQLIVLEDVEAVTSDSDLTDEERREALRNLGIEDETLIDALSRGL